VSCRIRRPSPRRSAGTAGPDARLRTSPTGSISRLERVRIALLLVVLRIRILTHGQEQAVAVDAGFVGNQLDQVEDQARALAGLEHQHARGVAVGQAVALAVQLRCACREIDGDTRGLLDGVGLELRRRRLSKSRRTSNLLPGRELNSISVTATAKACAPPRTSVNSRQQGSATAARTEDPVYRGSRHAPLSPISQLAFRSWSSPRAT
jgi:hypothetical protein